MRLIFRLCDYGILYNSVLRLKEKNIIFSDIIDNPICLNNIFGTKSEKAEQIEYIVPDLIKPDKLYSIYDLMYCGLSKNITELLVDTNVSINEINENERVGKTNMRNERRKNTYIAL